jgi:hypothetical protein
MAARERQPRTLSGQGERIDRVEKIWQRKPESMSLATDQHRFTQIFRKKFCIPHLPAIALATAGLCQSMSICGSHSFANHSAPSGFSALRFVRSFPAEYVFPFFAWFAYFVVKKSGWPFTFHVQLPFANSFGWFLQHNQYWNASSNSVPPFLDPISSAVHTPN